MSRDGKFHAGQLWYRVGAQQWRVRFDNGRLVDLLPSARGGWECVFPEAKTPSFWAGSSLDEASAVVQRRVKAVDSFRRNGATILEEET